MPDLLASTRTALQELFARSAVPPSAVERATFGTTLAVNAVVQHACAPVGLLISAGPGLDPAWFALGEHTAVIPGGLDHRGTEIAPLDTDEVRRIVSRWKAEGITSFACVSKFSTRNPPWKTPWKWTNPGNSSKRKNRHFPRTQTVREV